MLRIDVQLPQNLAEHLHRFQVSTHYQGRKRHTSRMLGFRGKVRQVTSVIAGNFSDRGDLRHLELRPGSRYRRNGSPPQVLRRVLFYFAKKALKMSSGIGNWLIGVGALVACIGLIVMPAALGEHPDTNLLILGACCVSLGSLMA